MVPISCINKNKTVMTKTIRNRCRSLSRWVYRMLCCSISTSPMYLCCSETDNCQKKLICNDDDKVVFLFSVKFQVSKCKLLPLKWSEMFLKWCVPSVSTFSRRFECASVERNQLILTKPRLVTSLHCFCRQFLECLRTFHCNNPPEKAAKSHPEMSQRFLK